MAKTCSCALVPLGSGDGGEVLGALHLQVREDDGVDRAPLGQRTLSDSGPDGKSRGPRGAFQKRSSARAVRSGADNGSD